MKMLIIVLLFLVQVNMCGQESSVYEILESDTIKFDLHEAGCFHSNSERIVIIKLSANLYQLNYTREREKALIKNISKVDLIKFGRTFSIEKNKKQSCISTTSTQLVLSSLEKSTFFLYYKCTEAETSMDILKKELHL